MGVPGSTAKKKQPGQRFSSPFFTVYRGGPMVLLQRELYFPKDPEGGQHFPVGSNFFQGGGGVQMLISI